jgi:cytochrome c553
VALIPAFALAGPPAPRPPASSPRTTSGPRWKANSRKRWTKKGDIKRGKETYEICGACHLPSGAGRPDGTFPQLAGQHTTVLIKQMADIRMGLRDNPTMYPFAKEMTDPQDLADTAAYIQSLCIPVDHGKYEGPDAAKQIADGKALYEKQCGVPRRTARASRKSSTRCSPASTTSTCCAR